MCVFFFTKVKTSSRTSGTSHDNVPKNAPAFWRDESALPLGWNYMLCGKQRQGNTLWLSSNAPNLRLSLRNANHSSIGFLLWRLPLILNHSLVWWNCSTLLNVINSHDRFWTSLHWVLWSREITPGHCEYLMDPRVSINLEEIFIALSFHVH